jgi:hypothetical protein
MVFFGNNAAGLNAFKYEGFGGRRAGKRKSTADTITITKSIFYEVEK